SGNWQLLRRHQALPGCPSPEPGRPLQALRRQCPGSIPTHREEARCEIELDNLPGEGVLASRRCILTLRLLGCGTWLMAAGPSLNGQSRAKVTIEDAVIEISAQLAGLS